MCLCICLIFPPMITEQTYILAACLRWIANCVLLYGRCWATIWRPYRSYLRLDGARFKRNERQIWQMPPTFYALPDSCVIRGKSLCSGSFPTWAISGTPLCFSSVDFSGPCLLLLKSFRRSCTIVVLDVYPRKYWWPLIQCWSSRSLKLACKGDSQALLIPPKEGWINHTNIPGDFLVEF